MVNRNVVRGFALIAVAAYFGIQASTYHVGSFAKAGPGLFPLLVSGIVALIGLTMIVQSRFEAAEPMHYNVRNVLLILAGLIGFVLIARHLNMLLAIVYLVFVATAAGADYSVVRNLKISAVLIVIAFAFHAFLGLDLPLF